MREAQKSFDNHDWDAVIATVRARIADDPASLADPFAKKWAGLRWRNLFLQATEQDEAAVKETGKLPGPLRKLPLSSDKGDDRRALAQRFMKNLTSADWTLDLPPAQHDPIENTSMLLVPGMLTGLLHPGAHAFPTEADALEQERGWTYYRSDAHPVRGCSANGADIIETLDSGVVYDMATRERVTKAPPGKVFMVGYSKGGPDILHFLVEHPEYVDRVAAVYTWAGAVGGSYTADSIYDQINGMDVKSSTDKLASVLSMINPSVVSAVGLRRVEEYDVVGAFNDLRTPIAEQYLADHGDYLDSLGIPFFNITGSTTPLEVPNFQFADTVQMSRHDANNDMQLTQAQATMGTSMATRLAMLHGHHWDIAYAPFPAHMRAMSPNLEHPFPKRAALIANWELLAELGLID